jgi:hypothetical protein
VRQERPDGPSTSITPFIRGQETCITEDHCCATFGTYSSCHLLSLLLLVTAWLCLHQVYLYHLALHHPGLSRSGTAPEGHPPPTESGHFRGLHSLGTPKVNYLHARSQLKLFTSQLGLRLLTQRHWNEILTVSELFCPVPRMTEIKLVAVPQPTQPSPLALLPVHWETATI